jgi:hypothetical protein
MVLDTENETISLSNLNIQLVMPCQAVHPGSIPTPDRVSSRTAFKRPNYVAAPFFVVRALKQSRQER